MSSIEENEWKLTYRRNLEIELSRCEERLKDYFIDDAQRYVQIQMARRICAAIERFEQGSYGQCEICNKPIESERLRAHPYAELCMGCQTSMEKHNSPWIHATGLVYGGA
jgi:RNA polymerase-binding transcription factor DksA